MHKLKALIYKLSCKKAPKHKFRATDMWEKPVDFYLSSLNNYANLGWFCCKSFRSCKTYNSLISHIEDAISVYITLVFVTLGFLLPMENYLIICGVVPRLESRLGRQLHMMRRLNTIYLHAVYLYFSGGVLPPGFAFRTTSLIERLMERDIKFDVISC